MAKKAKKSTLNVKTEEGRRDFLAGIGLNADAPALETLPPARPAVVPVGTTPMEFTLAPEGVDPHTMPVEDIVFDERLVAHFPSLAPKDRSVPVSYVFQFYKGPRGSERNKLLHAAIGKWLRDLHLARRAPGIVREKIKTSTETEELAMILQAKGIKAEDLIAMLSKEAN